MPSLVWICTSTPEGTNRAATSTAWVRYPPGLSRRSSTKEVAPWAVSPSMAWRTRSAAFWVTWRIFTTPTVPTKSVERFASS